MEHNEKLTMETIRKNVRLLGKESKARARLTEESGKIFKCYA